jgi:hypothetical protein
VTPLVVLAFVVVVLAFVVVVLAFVVVVVVVVDTNLQIAFPLSAYPALQLHYPFTSVLNDLSGQVLHMDFEVQVAHV